MVEPFEMTAPMAPNYWNGIGESPVGRTSFGFYDGDPIFVSEAPKVADFCTKTLGYPIVTIELQQENIYSCFESAITEYSAQVNQFNIREHMLSIQGLPTSTDLTQQAIGSGLSTIINLSQEYGTEAEAGGLVSLKKGSIPITSMTQSYDLQALWGDTIESGSRLEVRRVFHQGTPAISRYFDPFSTTGVGMTNLMAEFGWDNYSPAAQFLLMPLYEDILRVQAIEFNDMIRKSPYSFELINNKVRLFPIPQRDFLLFFDYYLFNDKKGLILMNGTANSGSSLVGDYSNAPYQNIQYANINSVGRLWIFKYTLALVKEALGNVRSKYKSVPIPQSEVTLDGDTLRTEAKTEKDELIKELRETLEQTGRKAQMDKQKEIANAMMEIYKKIPMPFMIG